MHKSGFVGEIDGMDEGVKQAVLVLNDTEYEKKLNAAGHIDELAEISQPGNVVPDKKGHGFAKDGFQYRTAYYKDREGTLYRLTLSVGKNGNVNTIYNIGKMKKITATKLGARRPWLQSSNLL